MEIVSQIQLKYPSRPILIVMSVMIASTPMLQMEFVQHIAMQRVRSNGVLNASLDTAVG